MSDLGGVVATLTAGIDHVAVITRDLDRAVEFWRLAIDARFHEMSDERGRHGFVELAPGGSSVLHLFEVPEDYTGPHPSGPMMRRGRIDHLAIAASGEAALVEIRDRLVGLRASFGSIQLFADELLSVHGTDPDGMEFEVACHRTGELLEEGDWEPAT